MQDAIKRIFIEDWLLRNGSSYRLRLTKYDKQIFEMRLPDPYHYSGQTTELRPLMVWLRLRKDLQSEVLLNPVFKILFRN